MVNIWGESNVVLLIDWKGAVRLCGWPGKVVDISAAGTGRLVRIEGTMNAAKHRQIPEENLLQSTEDFRLRQRFTRTITPSIQPQQHWMASEQERESPWVTQPKPILESHWESVERLEDCCSPTLPIPLDRAWTNLQGRMGETPQIQMWRGDTDTPKKTRSCNHCQRCFYKVLTWGVEYYITLIFLCFIFN